MKKIAFLGIFFYICTSMIFAFNPPVDILEMNYDKFMKEYENQIILEDGYLQVNKQVEYYGTTISYNISFKKNEVDDFYFFFERPYNKTEQFNEFYSDILLWYAKKSAFVVFTDKFNLTESEPIFDFYINEKKPVRIYRKESMKNGFRGFGIVFNASEKYNRGEYPINYYCDPFRTDILDLESFIPEKINKSSIYIQKDFIQDEVNCEVLKEDFYDGYFMKDFFLKPNAKYQVYIDNWENEQALKDYRIVTSNNISTTFFEIIKDEKFYLYSDNEPLFLILYGQELEDTEYGYNVLIKEETIEH